MLVEINLLPQKETKKVGMYIILAVLGALFLLVTAFYFYQIHSTKTEITSIEKQIENTNKVIAELQKKQGTTESASSITQLKTAVDWASKNRIETIPVMRHLTSLLPERGFIKNFTYQEAGTVALTVQFDTPREAASYLDSLNHSTWIEKASLQSLNIATDSTSTTTATQTNTTTNTESNSTTTTVDSNTNSTTDNLDSQYVPRYTGQYEIQVNKDAILKSDEQAKESGSTEEGVSGS